VIGVENDYILVLVCIGRGVMCEEVMYACGSVLHGVVGKIESGSHGGRGVLVWLV